MNHARRILGTTFAAALLGGALAANLAAAQDTGGRKMPPPDAPKEVRGIDVILTTDDKMKLVATHYSSGVANAPGVVLLHMYKSDRTAWAPLVPYLCARGIDVIAVDMRGHGASSKQGATDLSAKVDKRVASLFAEMHRDAIAAVRWLAKDGRCDPKRIALVGASVGCSVAIDAARRYPGETSAVVCLTAGEKYLDLNSLSHVKKWPAGEPLLLLTHATEANGGSRAIHDAVPGSRLIVYDDALAAEAKDQEGWAHGTHMFGRMPCIERTVASFLAAKAGSKTDDVVIDGVVTSDGPDADPWAKAVDVSGPGGGKAWAYRVGRRIVFGGIAPANCKAVRVWAEAGTIPLGKDVPADLPKLGVPTCAAIDLTLGRVIWVFPTLTRMPNMPDGVEISIGGGMGKPPAVRVVRPAPVTAPADPGATTAGPAGATFEGEWLAPTAASNSEEKGAVRMAVFFDTEVPAAQTTEVEVDLDSRHLVPSR